MSGLPISADETASSVSRTGVYFAILQLVLTLGWTTYLIYLPMLAAQVGIAPSTVIPPVSACDAWREPAVRACQSTWKKVAHKQEKKYFFIPSRAAPTAAVCGFTSVIGGKKHLLSAGQYHITCMASPAAISRKTRARDHARHCSLAWRSRKAG